MLHALGSRLAHPRLGLVPLLVTVGEVVHDHLDLSPGANGMAVDRGDEKNDHERETSSRAFDEVPLMAVQHGRASLADHAYHVHPWSLEGPMQEGVQVVHGYLVEGLASIDHRNP